MAKKKSYPRPELKSIKVGFTCRGQDHEVVISPACDMEPTSWKEGDEFDNGIEPDELHTLISVNVDCPECKGVHTFDLDVNVDAKRPQWIAYASCLEFVKGEYQEDHWKDTYGESIEETLRREEKKCPEFWVEIADLLDFDAVFLANKFLVRGR